MRFIEALNYATEQLKNHSDSPEFEATVLLEELSEKSKEEILIKNEHIQGDIFSLYKKHIKRRTAGEPLQYIIGKVNFLGIDIIVSPKTFIPRPETEFMAESAIKDGKFIKDPVILEIGTGSGAIAISLALNLPDSLILATDISKEALEICKKNITSYHLENQILPICADSTESFRIKKQFDIIISNPPYIPEMDLTHLPALVMKEPSVALDGGKNGVHIINKILKSTSTILNETGILYIELTEANILHLDIPEDLTFSILDDQFGKKRILEAEKK